MGLTSSQATSSIQGSKVISNAFDHGHEAQARAESFASPSPPRPAPLFMPGVSCSPSDSSGPPSSCASRTVSRSRNRDDLLTGRRNSPYGRPSVIRKCPIKPGKTPRWIDQKSLSIAKDIEAEAPEIPSSQVSISIDHCRRLIRLPPFSQATAQCSQDWDSETIVYSSVCVSQEQIVWDLRREGFYSCSRRSRTY